MDTHEEFVDDGQIRFSIRIPTAEAHAAFMKRKEDAKTLENSNASPNLCSPPHKADPFSPPDPLLVVKSTATHHIVLNKF